MSSASKLDFALAFLRDSPRRIFLNRLSTKLDSINDIMWLINVEKPGTSQQLDCLNKLMTLVKDDRFSAEVLIIAMFTHMEYLDGIFLLALGSDEFARYRGLGELLMKLEQNGDLESVAPVLGLWRDTRSHPWMKLESYDDALAYFHSELSMQRFAIERLRLNRKIEFQPLINLFIVRKIEGGAYRPPTLTYPGTDLEVPMPKIYSAYFREESTDRLPLTVIG